MDRLTQDLRYAFRSFFRQPAFALTAIVTLALGIAATTAIFSVYNGVILRPLPFDEPDRIVAITTLWTKTGRRMPNVSAPDFHDWRAQSESFEALGYYAGGEGSVTVNGAADYATAIRVTPGFLDVLRAKASVGRLLTGEEQSAGGPLAVILTDAYWRRQFNADPGAIGATLKFDERVFTIAGVLAPDLRFPARADFYYPAWVEPETTSRGAHNYRAIGRLRDGVTLEQAQQEMTAISRRLEQSYPRSNTGKMVVLQPLQDYIVGATEQTILVLLGAVGVVLLIACANVANLLLARASVRTREMVVRAAVGAGRGRLIRQLLTESAVLGLAAGLAGAWLARLGIRALLAFAPATLPRVGDVQVDVAALVFALGMSLAASFLFGLVPALQISRVQLADGLRQGGKGSSMGARTGWVRSAFVVAEVALAVVLVVSAGLLGRSLSALTSVDMGFDPEGILVMTTSVPVQTLADAPRATAFYRDLLEELRATPGIRAVAAVRSLPTQVSSNGGYWIEGGPSPNETGVTAPQAVFNVVTPGYFSTVRVPVQKGRDFTQRDVRSAPFVAIINEALARTAFPGQNPIGRRIQCGLDTLEFMTIVGVVGNVRTYGPSMPAAPELYMPYLQHPGPSTALSLVVRPHAGDPLALVEPIRRQISAMNSDVPIKASTMEDTLTLAVAPERFRTFLLVVFAGVALALALAGVYGVMAYTVSQRVPELGVRIALGATPGHIMGLILGYGGKLAALGLVLGLLLALASGRMLEGLLFGVTARDPLILAVVTAAIALATCAACYVPGRRAVRVDPVSAMRAE